MEDEDGESVDDRPQLMAHFQVKLMLIALRLILFVVL